jgi:predicted O-methyltransferase YrrM
MLACLNNTKHAIECGTSYGVSTMYLALAIHKNNLGRKQDAVGVVTMEKDAVKSARAREVWSEAGAEVEALITLHEGDLLHTLADNTLLPEVVDLLFLDGMFYPLHHQCERL